MSSGGLQSVVRRLRKAAGSDGGDGELLTQYLVHGQQSAFEALVRRHGPTVLGVCKRVLGNGPDADDAFQAVFLVLLRKAASIQDTKLLGNWLYGVAYRTARKARAMNAKRRARESVAAQHRLADRGERSWQDVQPILDEELLALPEKYRAAIILCDLEGCSRKEAAHALGWPEGTVATRLTEGRARLAKRLTRRGVTLSGAGLVALLADNVARAALPASLLAATLGSARAFVLGSGIAPAVAALTNAMLRGSLLSKPAMVIAVLALAALVGLGLSRTPPPSGSAANQAAQAAAVVNQPTANEPIRPASKSAETPAKHEGLDVANDPIDRLLVRWETAMANVDTVVAELQRIAWQRDRDPEAVLSLEPGKFLRGQNGMSSRANLVLRRQPELCYALQYLPGVEQVRPVPEAFHYERYVFAEDNTFLFITNPVERVLQVHTRPSLAQRRLTDDGFLNLLFSPDAAETKKRFKLSYNGASPDQPDVFHRLNVLSIETTDRADFTDARVVLNSKTLLPEHLWLRLPSGKTVTWNFLRTQTNVEVSSSEFELPLVPAGWTLVEKGR